METHTLSLPISFALFLFFIYMVIKTVKGPSKFKKSKLPPGPWKLPFIGNIHQLAGPLPHYILRDLANKYGPLMSLQLGEVSAIVVSSSEIAQQVMKSYDLNFADRPRFITGDVVFYNGLDIVLSRYGDYWRQVRKICTLEVFCSKSVQKFQGIRKEEIMNLIKLISQNEGSAIDIGKELYSLTTEIAARAAFGMKMKDPEAFALFLTEAVELSSGFSVPDMFPSVKILHMISRVQSRLEKVYQKMDKLLADIINEHRDRNTEADHQDLIDVLLGIQKQGHLNQSPFTDSNIKAIILGIVAAASETSSVTMVWAMSEMLKNPKVMGKVQAEVRKVYEGKENVDETKLHELNYLKLVIKETLRLHPPAPLLVPRECREQCRINGFDIPLKTKVVINAWAIGRDPTFWADAETFKPERFENSSVDFKGTDFDYIPFGAGRRMCPGISFALPNIMLTLGQMLYHFDWKLPGGLKNEELDMSEAFGITAGRKHDLCVVPVAHASTT